MAWRMPYSTLAIGGSVEHKRDEKATYMRSLPATSATLPSLRNFPSLLRAMRTPAGDHENLYPRALSAA